jgi:hypothetical protein
MSRNPESFGRKVLGIALLIVLLPVILPLAIALLFLVVLNKATTYLIIWIWWLPQGKDVLYVSSESPTWHDYMSSEVFPLVAKRAVTLNWSTRKRWPKFLLASHVFRTFGGRREFNPLVMLFRPFRAAQVFRLYRPFKDRKRGDPTSLDKLRRDLAQALNHK